MRTENNSTKSFIKFVSAVLIFGTVGIFRRYIPLSSSLLSCLRGLIGSAFLFVFCKASGKRLNNRIGMKKILILAFTGVLIGVNWILLFEAYNYTTVATATLCYYAEPTLVVILAAIFLKDKLTVKKIICVIVSIIGMFFVSGVLDAGTIGVSDRKGIFLGLSAAMLYASDVVINKSLPGIDVYEKTFIELLSASLVLIPYVLLTETVSFSGLNITEIVLMIIMGVVHTGLAYALYFGSLDGLNTQTVAIFSYLDPVTALILSAVILHESMTVLSIVGAVLIIASAIIGELKKND